eukprot:6187452-Pleurochrysis_carterae.AAC.2
MRRSRHWKLACSLSHTHTRAHSRTHIRRGPRASRAKRSELAMQHRACCSPSSPPLILRSRASRLPLY